MYSVMGDAPALAAFAEGTVKPAIALRILRPDGTVFGFTRGQRRVTLPDFDVVTPDGFQLFVPETTYLPGLQITDLQESDDLSQADNMEATLTMGDGLTQADVDKGLFYNGEAWLIIYLRDHLDYQILRKRFTIGETIASSVPGQDVGKVTFKLRGLEAAFQNEIGEVTSGTSRAKWGDEELDFFDLDGDTDDGFAARVTTTVDSVDSTYKRRRFTLSDTIGQPARRFTGGTVTFTDGDNSGIEKEIMAWNEATGQVTLVEDLPFDVTAGDGVIAQIAAPVTSDEWKLYFGDLSLYPGCPEIPTVEQAAEIAA